MAFSFDRDGVFDGLLLAWFSMVSRTLPLYPFPDWPPLLAELLTQPPIEIGIDLAKSLKRKIWRTDSDCGWLSAKGTDTAIDRTTYRLGLPLQVQVLLREAPGYPMPLRCIITNCKEKDGFRLQFRVPETGYDITP